MAKDDVVLSFEGCQMPGQHVVSKELQLSRPRYPKCYRPCAGEAWGEPLSMMLASFPITHSLKRMQRLAVILTFMCSLKVYCHWAVNRTTAAPSHKKEQPIMMNIFDKQYDAGPNKTCLHIERRARTMAPVFSCSFRS